MDNGNHIAHRVLTLAMTVGAPITAAVIGMAAAHADPGSADPAGLLDSAAADLAQAHTVLGDADVPSSLQQLLSNQTQSATAFAQLISQAQSIQDPLLSSDNSSVAGFADLLFGNIDRQFAQDSAAVLAADQAFAANPSDATIPGLEIADFQFDGAAVNSLFPELMGVFVDRLLGIDVPIQGFSADLLF